MHQKIKDIIKESCHQLSLCITLNDELWNLLGQHAPNIISTSIKQEIQTKKTHYSQVTALLEFLQKRTDSDFVNFCKSLVAANQKFIVKNYFREALRYTGKRLVDIELELNEQPDSIQQRPSESGTSMETIKEQLRQHPPSGLRKKEKMDLNTTAKAYNVKVIPSSKEFYEKNKEEAYPVEPESHGYALIINVYDVSGRNQRKGTDIDRDKIKRLLNALEFKNISTYDDKDGLKAEEIKEKVQEFVKTVSKRAKRVALFFLSHGGPGTISGTDGGKVKIDNLIQYLSPENAPGLAGIPKLMVFQACRGKLMEDAQDAQLDEDLAVCYASQDGYVSLRCEYTGSVFIAAFVQVLEKHAHCDDIKALMEKVTEQVREDAKEKGAQYQTPDIQQNLTKNLYFFPGHPEFKE